MKPASARESPSLDGEGEEEGRKDEEGEEGRREKQQAGMKVRKPSLLKNEPTKPKMCLFSVLTVKSSNSHRMNAVCCKSLYHCSENKSMSRVGKEKCLT